MKILVLGGHGFVGTSVCALLKDTKHKVFSLSRANGLDLTNYTFTLKKLSEIKPEVIINCAAHVGSLHYVTHYAADVVNDNMRIVLNIYQAAKEACPSVMIISPIANCSYPGNANIQVESEWWDGPVHKTVWSYANVRRMQVVTSECYAMQYDLKTVNFIVPNCYGPGDSTDPNKTHALNGMIIRMLKAQKDKSPEFEIWGTGEPMREWLYVKDLAKILANCATTGESEAHLVNIAQNKAYSIKETAEMIKKFLGYTGRLLFNTAYPDGAPMKKLDDTLFRNKFPDFTFMPIDTGIKETIRYYQKILG